jgi:hypothetical protein
LPLLILQQPTPPVSVTGVQWILLQKLLHVNVQGAVPSGRSFVPEPGSNLEGPTDPRALARPSQPPPLSPLFSVASLARPESNPAPSLPLALLLFRSAHIGVGARPLLWPAFLPETNQSTLLAPTIQAPTQRLARYKKQPDRCNLRPSKPPRDRLGCEYTMQEGGPPRFYNVPVRRLFPSFRRSTRPLCPERRLLSFVELREPPYAFCSCAQAHARATDAHLRRRGKLVDEPGSGAGPRGAYPGLHLGGPGQHVEVLYVRGATHHHLGFLWAGLTLHRPGCAPSPVV